MKKRRILLLVLAVSLLLCSCGEVKIESITLSKNAAELKEGESVTLSAVVAPENATESYGWKSADEGGNTNILAVSESGKTAACSVTVAAPTAYELLNDAERELFDYMTGTMLKSFYNAPAVRIRKLFNMNDGDLTYYAIVAELQGTNKLGGTIYKRYIMVRQEGGVFCVPLDDESDYGTEIPVDQMDPAKINAALEEYWSNVGMHG